MHTFHIGTLCIIERDGKILFVQEGKEHVRGQWDLPGGSMKDGESFKENAEREVLEETGLKVNAEDMIGFYWEESVRTGKSVLLAVIKADVVEDTGSRSRNEEILDQKFFRPEELEEIDLRKQNRKEMIRDFFNGRKAPSEILTDTR